jgi:hypothetical protein
MSHRLVGRWINEGWEVNHPSIQPSGLTSTRVVITHATSQEDKAWGRSDWGGGVRREGRALTICKVSDSREEGE